MSRRRVAAALAAAPVAALLGWHGDALGRDRTYCVGGYSGTPPAISSACGRADVARRHSRWHLHTFLVVDGLCQVCFDEEDNSCATDFLASHGQYRVSDPFSCIFRTAAADRVVEHVIGGERAAPPPPPPPPALEPVILSVSPGPHAAGDEVTVQAGLVGPDGAVHAAGPGSLLVRTSDGREIEVDPGLTPGGRARAEFALPASESVTLVWRAPDVPSTQGVLTRQISAARQLRVELCAWRARVVAPLAGAGLVAGSTAPLRTELVPADPGRGAPAAVALTWSVEPVGDDPISITAAADGGATWTPDPELTGRVVRLTVGGTADGRAACASDPVEVTIDRLGIGVDGSGLPPRCYAGHPCSGEVKLVRPDDPVARDRVDRLLSGGAKVVLVDAGGTVATLDPSADDRYRFETIYEGPHSESWRVEIHGVDGTVHELPAHAVEVRPELVLALPESLDLGTVLAGAPFYDACAKLDFRTSQNAAEHRWQLELDGLGDCTGEPVLAFANPFGQAEYARIGSGLEVASLDPGRPELDVCLLTTGCVGGVSPPGVHLVVRPVTPEFRDQVRRVRLSWAVQGATFTQCHPWALPLVGMLGGVVLVVGWWTPHRFPPGLALRVARNAQGLGRSAPIDLAGVPGSSAGLFRSARLGLHESGDLTASTRHALVIVRAVREGSRIEARGTLERLDRRTRAFVEVPSGQEVPTSQDVFRVGGVVFRLEGGA